MTVTIYDIFEINRVLHLLMEQQISYNIQTAFKIHSLVKWLDETEQFILERMKMMFGNDPLDDNNPLYTAFLSSQIPLMETTLTLDDLLNTEGEVKISVNDVEVLEKMLRGKEKGV